MEALPTALGSVVAYSVAAIAGSGRERRGFQPERVGLGEFQKALSAASGSAAATRAAASARAAEAAARTAAAAKAAAAAAAAARITAARTTAEAAARTTAEAAARTAAAIAAAETAEARGTGSGAMGMIVRVMTRGPPSGAAHAAVPEA